MQQTNSSKDCLHQESTHAQETPRNEVSTEKAGCSPSKGAPVSTSTASEEVDRAVLHGESSKKNSGGRELSSINGLALGLCFGVAFGIIFDSLAIGIGLGLALGAAFDALKGKIGK
ncbi:hypothetical protein [Slackia piriformis]|uniref:hypothetical protein n=1 Tax=Slackia piriformis TaxID=626934 RepID=UPI0026DB6FE3|nr:hypothetical protein [Slackia piriformis]MDO5024854.1 hypothetical protein [Slackia piriformis]